jgi:ataxia telangiectasia mutated family protein
MKDIVFSDWIGTASSFLAHSLGGIYGLLIPCFSFDVNFACSLFPALLYEVFTRKASNERCVFVQSIMAFLEKCTNTEAMESVVDGLIYLRQRTKLGVRPKYIADSTFLELDFFELAKIAFRCQRFNTALLCMEIWIDMKGSQNIKLDVLYENDKDIPLHTKMLMDIYAQVEDPDMFYGIDCLLNDTALLKRHEQEKDWEKLFRTCSYTMDVNPKNSNGVDSLLVKSMRFSGLSSLSQMFLDNQCAPDLESLRVEAAWKMSEWDFDIGGGDSFDHSLFKLLKTAMQSPQLLSLQLPQCYEDVSRKLWNLTSINYATYMDASYKCFVFKEIDLSSHFFSCDLLRFKEIVNELNDRVVSVLDSLDFDKLETVLQVRSKIAESKLSCMIPDLQRKVSYGVCHNFFFSHLYKFSKIARNNKRHDLSLHASRRLTSNNSTTSFIWKCFGTLEKAKTQWSLGERYHAIKVLQFFTDMQFSSENLSGKYEYFSLYEDKSKNMNLLKSVTGYFLKAKMLSQLGTWKWETRSERPRTIMQNYFMKAFELLRNEIDRDEVQKMVSVVYKIATYANSQYDELSKSKLMIDSVELNRRKSEELRQLGEVVTVTRDSTAKRLLSFKKRRIEKQVASDKSEIEQMYQEQTEFLHLSLDGYLQCLRRCDKYNSTIYSFTSLWLANIDRPQLAETIEDGLSTVPSWKFLGLIYQLTARLGNETTTQQLTKLISRITFEHPYHSLYQTFALINSNLYPGFKESDINATSVSRKEVAQAILGRLKASALKGTISSMDSLLQAYIELANLETKVGSGSSVPFKRNWRMYSIQDLPRVPVPTVEVPISVTGEYKGFTSIVEFEKKFFAVGGINTPKRIECIGSDGIRYKQLVKGKDDLRQDAVMEQIFSVVNDLLKQNKQTRTRKMKIRTYSVIPLTSRSGLLEWVSNTIPVGHCWEELRKRYQTLNELVLFLWQSINIEVL